jgi:myo-inositol-1(or 4)-monophosphatase
MSFNIEEVLEIVEEAGQLALLYYGKVSRTLKSDMTIVTEADEAIENFLKVSLTALAPDYGFIGEETEENKEPANGETRSWVVDALDGTMAFAAGISIWTPAVHIVDGSKPIAGACINPVTDELFWADEEGGAYCNGSPLQVNPSTSLERNSIIIGPTNHHQLYKVDFPGRIYSMGAPIYQLCQTAKGTVPAMFFNPAIYIWDLVLPSLLIERAGGVLVYESGRPVDIAELMDRSRVPETVFAGNKEMVDILRQQVNYIGK